MDISVYVASLSAATKIAKELINADRALDKADLKLKLADLMVELANARTEAIEIQTENARLTRDLAEIQSRLSFQGSMRFKSPYYINVGQRDRGPYCANCWDAEQLAMHLIVRDPGEWLCRRCKQFVEDEDYKGPEAPQIRLG